MQYLLQDLLKLPLEDRLAIVEKLICTMMQNDCEEQLKALLQQYTLVASKE